jgi:hypothetical protein
MFCNKKRLTRPVITDTPAEVSEHYDVVCETAPYTLLNIITADEYGKTISYFQFIYNNPCGGLRICDTRNLLNSIHMDLSDDEKPYVVETHYGANLHIPRNSVVKRKIISNSFIKSNQSDNSSDSILPILAGTAGLATGIAIGSVQNL